MSKTLDVTAIKIQKGIALPSEDSNTFEFIKGLQAGDSFVIPASLYRQMKHARQKYNVKLNIRKEGDGYRVFIANSGSENLAPSVHPTEFKIEKGIPLKPSRRQGCRKAFFASLDVWDSFVVPSYRSAASLQTSGKKHGVKLAIRTMPDKTVRVWVVEKQVQT
jgi:hypothetical protein